MAENDEIQALTRLTKTAAKILTDQMMQVYADAKNESNRGILRDILLPTADDTPVTLLLKQNTFYFGCGRVPLVQTEAFIPASKRPKMQPHGYILTRPDDRRKYTDGTYDDNGKIKVPWMDADKLDNLRGLAYKMGNRQLRFDLADEQGYLFINVQSVSEGTAVIEQIASTILPFKLPAGAVKDNITETKRKATAKTHSREGQMMRAFAVDYRNGRGEMLLGRYHL
jgi:hypothetical protein